MTTNKQAVTLKQDQLRALTRSYCQKYVNDEYDMLCSQLIAKMARKRQVPFTSGRVEIWAAAVVHAIGTINFLFDPETRPYASLESIATHFSVTASTVRQKSKRIRDMFSMNPFGPDFLTEARRGNSPFVQVAVVDGFLVPVSA